MQVCVTEKELKKYCAKQIENGKILGFVPTMGALHKGHLSLLEIAKKECNFVVVSIFVNPTQFNNPEDLEKYPRTLQKDLDLLNSAGCDLVFTPTVEVVYPKPAYSKFNFGLLDNLLEANHRPGHFNGVAQVVSRLFELVAPNKAFFGLKDYQQFLIVKQLVKQLKLKIEIIGCSILRDEKNIACSSRNTLLSDKEYSEATYIPIWMEEAKKLAKTLNVSQIKVRMQKIIAKRKLVKLHYFEICNLETLEPLKDFEAPNNSVALIAVQVGKIRLIDNTILE